MKKEDLKPGQLYHLMRDVKNPNGNKQQGTKSLRDLAFLPSGIVFRCASYQEVRDQLSLDGPLKHALDAPTQLVLVKPAQLTIEVGRNRTQRVSVGAMYLGIDSPFLTAILEHLMPVERTAEDFFREAGLPLYDRYDNSFLNVCEWAAEKGLLPVAQVQRWRDEQRREELDARVKQVAGVPPTAFTPTEVMPEVSDEVAASFAGAFAELEDT